MKLASMTSEANFILFLYPLPQFGIRIVHKKLVVSQIFCIFIGDLQQVTNIFDMTTDYKVTELFCIIDEFLSRTGVIN